MEVKQASRRDLMDMIEAIKQENSDLAQKLGRMDEAYTDTDSELKAEVSKNLT